MSRRCAAVAVVVAFSLTACEPTTDPKTGKESARYSSPSISPTGASLIAGDSLKLTAQVFDSVANGFVSRPAVWSSSDPTVAVVDGSGLLRAKYRDGYSTIGADFDGFSATILVRVQGTPYVFPDTSVLVPSLQRELHVESLSSNLGLRQLSGAAWSSTNPAVASVDGDGRVTAHAVGEATIVAGLGPTTASAKVYVKQAGAPLRFVQVVVKDGTACAMEAAGDVYCWGDLYTQSNLAAVMDRCEGTTFTDPRVGHQRSSWRCSAIPLLMQPARRPVRLIDASLFGLAADSTLVPIIRPITPLGGDGVRFADVSIDPHACGITGDARGYCWNANGSGELGNGTIQSGGPWSPTPVQIAGDRRWSVLSTGYHSTTCGLTTVGEAYCWGYDLKSRLGVGTSYTSPSGCLSCVVVPMRVLTDARFTAIATAGHSTCALADDRQTYCWGERPSGVPASEPVVPVIVSGVPTLKSVRRSYERLWAVDDAGSLYLLGRNEGAASFASVFSFARVPLPFAVKAVAPQIPELGANCAISASDDKVYCWGATRGRGLLGDGSYGTASPAAPARVFGQTP